MKIFDVILCQRSELKVQKPVEIKAVDFINAVNEAHRSYSDQGWMIMTCAERQLPDPINEGEKEFEILLVKTDGLMGEPSNKFLTIFANSDEDARTKAVIPYGYHSAGIREVIKVEGYQNFVVTE